MQIHAHLCLHIHLHAHIFTYTYAIPCTDAQTCTHVHICPTALDVLTAAQKPPLTELRRAVEIMTVCLLVQTQRPRRGPTHATAPVDLRDQSKRPQPQLRPLCTKASLHAECPSCSSQMSPSMTPLLWCYLMYFSPHSMNGWDLALPTGEGKGYMVTCPASQLTLGEGLHLISARDTGVWAVKAGHRAGGTWNLPTSE